MITAVVRTIILYLLIILGIRLMGKRQIGELEPSELVLSLIIADLAAVPMQDFGIPLIMQQTQHRDPGREDFNPGNGEEPLHCG